MDDAWAPEDIPDPDNLYMRAHRSYFRDGKLQAGVFRDHGGGMSTNWHKYCSSIEARQRAKNPRDNAVIGLRAFDARQVPLEVRHTPNIALGDRSHTDVIGEKTSEVRLLLLNSVTIHIHLDA